MIKAGGQLGQRGEKEGCRGRCWGRKVGYWEKDRPSTQPPGRQWLSLEPALRDVANKFWFQELSKQLVWEWIPGLDIPDQMGQKDRMGMHSPGEHRRNATRGHWGGAGMRKGQHPPSDSLLFRWKAWLQISHKLSRI